MSQTTLSQAPLGNINDEDYTAFLHRLQTSFLEQDGPFFTTDAEDLWEAYLASFPEEIRQFHNCSSCRHFVQRYGGLVILDADGKTKSAVWRLEDVQAASEYLFPFQTILRLVEKAKVTGVFLSEDRVWGDPLTGPWQHLAVHPKPPTVFKRSVLTARQAMAEKKEDYKNVKRALSEISPTVLAQALTLLRANALYRSEKLLGAAEWLAELQKSSHHGWNPNIVWRAVATAPAGFCHPRSGMLSTLLQDLENDLSFEEVSRRFSAKMSPLQYQRPQAPPKAGNLAQAEKVVAELGAAGSLTRRYARLEEVQAIWLHVEPHEEPKDGVFGHLKPKGKDEANLTVPPTVMTWDKFSRTVLPEAKSLDILVPGSGNYCALTTAVNPEAPPILQWDREEQRNPVAWYLYPGGSPARQWGLVAGAWVPVTAITLQPSSWFDSKLTHQSESVLFLLQGAKDSLWQSCGNAIFPETLRSEFHGIRATIEAYSRAATLEGHDEASACGLRLQKGIVDSGIAVRVKTGSVVMSYRLDRWD